MTIQDLISDLEKLPKDARVEFEFGNKNGDVMRMEIDRIITLPHPIIKLVLA